MAHRLFSPTVFNLLGCRVGGRGGPRQESHRPPRLPKKGRPERAVRGRGAVGGKRGSPHEGGTRRLPELGMCLGRGPVLLGGVGHGVGHKRPGGCGLISCPL